MRPFGYYLQKWLKVPVIYDDVPVFSKVLHSATSFLRNPLKMYKTFEDPSEMIDLKGRAPTLTHFDKF